MSFGKMTAFIDIVEVRHAKDAEGFVRDIESVVASVRADKEERHGSVQWANRAAFTTATAMFRLRMTPGLRIDTSYLIICDGIRYQLLSVEDVKGRGMYWEILAEKMVRTKRGAGNGKSAGENAGGVSEKGIPAGGQDR